MTIQEMIARQQAIVSGARAAGRDLTAEERAEFDGLQRQIDAAGNNPPPRATRARAARIPPAAPAVWATITASRAQTPPRPPARPSLRSASA